MKSNNFCYIGDNNFCKIYVKELLDELVKDYNLDRTIFFIECNKFRSLPDLHQRLLLIKQSHPTASVLFITRKFSFLPMESRHCIGFGSSIQVWRITLKKLLTGKGNIDEIIDTYSLNHYLHHISPSMLKVATLLASGSTIDEIAEHLAISNKAVYSYATKMRFKLNMFSLVQLCFYLENEFQAANPLVCGTVVPKRSMDEQ